jgi:RNA polymerase sigma-70 factor (ECF subfamily)
MTDAAVVRRVLAGDVEAFAVLVGRYYDRYARYAVHMVGNREDAEEALQDAFLRAYRSLERYEERERFGAWLFRILVNQCRTKAAGRRRRERAFPDVDAAELDAAELAGDPTADQHDLRDRLERALAQLPPEQREAVVLRYGEDMTYEDMAAVTGAGVSALKMRVKRAFGRLRELLQEAYCV